MSVLLGYVVLVAALVGVPISFVLLAGPTFAILGTDNLIYMNSYLQRIFAGANAYPILAIPMFLLAGELLNTGRITERLVNFATDAVGHWRGGLAQVNNLSSLLFAGLSGSALADAASLGRILIPEMERKGYSRSFAAAVTAAGSLVGPIVPPSIIMIIYAYVMNLSVGKLFAAGIVPGLLMTAGLLVMTNVLARRNGFPREPERKRLRYLAATGVKVLPAMMAPFIVIGGILSGVFTATEASAVAVVYSLILGIFWTRAITPSILLAALWRAAISSGTILLIVAAAAALAWLITLLRLPQTLSEFFLAITQDRNVFLFFVLVLLVVAGTVLDAGPAILIFGPILGPVVASYGIDPAHFAIIMCLNLTIGLATPPFGMVLFATSAVSKVSVQKIVFAIWPFMAVHLLILLLITYIPAISLTVPALLGFN